MSADGLSATVGAVDEWEAILAVEGTPTGDGRLFELGAIRWRDLPLTLLYMPATDDGHDGSFAIGQITSIERVPTGEGTANIVGRGPFVADPSEQVAEAIALVREGTVRGVSIDVALDLFRIAPMDEGLALVDEDGNPVEGEAIDELMDEPDADEPWLEIDNVVTLIASEATIMAATVVPTPAFAEALIEPLAEAAVVASAAPAVPPAEWFADPRLTGPTPLTVRADGSLYGHLALWGTCHVGMPGCFTAPPSPTGYALFHLGERETDAGPVAVGQITIDANHADTSLSAARAREHYEHTGAVVADVVAGEDEHGVWVAGALRPDATAEQIIALRGSKLSGDWRNQGQGLDLVGALAVNVPGFPVPRGAFANGADADEALSLVAAGVIRAATRTSRLAGRITRVRAVTASGRGALPPRSAGRGDELPPLDALAARVHAPEIDRLALRAAEPDLERLAARV